MEDENLLDVIKLLTKAINNLDLNTPDLNNKAIVLIQDAKILLEKQMESIYNDNNKLYGCCL